METHEFDFSKYIVRVLVEVNYYIIDENGIMIKTHTEQIETDSNSITHAKELNVKSGGATINAMEIRLYKNTKSPIKIAHTIKLT